MRFDSARPILCDGFKKAVSIDKPRDDDELKAVSPSNGSGH